MARATGPWLCANAGMAVEIAISMARWRRRILWPPLQSEYGGLRHGAQRANPVRPALAVLLATPWRCRFLLPFRSDPLRPPGQSGRAEGAAAILVAARAGL